MPALEGRISGSPPEYKENKNGVNSFYFIDVLSESLANNAVVVTDMNKFYMHYADPLRQKRWARGFFLPQAAMRQWDLGFLVQ